MPPRAGSSTDRTRLLLASASPRRRRLLEQLGVTFEVLAVAVIERPERGEPPPVFASRMADEKARAATRLRPDRWILAADTVVALGERAFGKPADLADAERMLRELAGRVHAVHTAVVLLRPDGRAVERTVVTTAVRFRALTSDEIRSYVAGGEPLDKAGAYAIQGEGAHLVDRVEGSYTNVIGLPLAEVAAWLDTWQLR